MPPNGKPPSTPERPPNATTEDPAAGFEAHKARTRENRDVVEELAQREAQLEQESGDDGDHGFNQENPTRRVPSDQRPKDEG